MKNARILATIFSLVLLSGFTAIDARGQTVGLFLNTDESYDGHTLFAPNASRTTYLIDNHGKL